ncbi:MAG: class I SAM-dependent methyltransferase [Bacteroidales bacterium]
METLTACPVCNAEEFTAYGQRKDYLVTQQVFDLAQCENCGFVYTQPRPDEKSIATYYKSADYVSHTDSKRTFFEFLYARIKRYMMGKKYHIINKLTSNKSKKLILDYGCATGDFLMYLQSKGHKVMGFEPDKDAREKAIRKGVTVTGRIEDLDNPEYRNQVDVITLWHVLEHIHDLNSSLDLFHKLLRKNGVILVAVPEYKSYDAKFYGDDWAAWDVPRHLNHFEEKTLSALFMKNGFRLEKTFPLIFDAFYVSILTEKNKGNGVTGVIRAIMIGFISNIKALTGSVPWSSQIYIFRK